MGLYLGRRKILFFWAPERVRAFLVWEGFNYQKDYPKKRSISNLRERSLVAPKDAKGNEWKEGTRRVNISCEAENYLQIMKD